MLELWMRKRLWLLAGLLVGMPFVGCGGKSGSYPATVPVSGRIMLGGEPVNEALVVFYPNTTDGMGGSAAQATTDNDGRFELTTFQSADGAVPGDYVVLIIKKRAENVMTPQESRAYYERTGTSPPLPTYKDLLPTKYASHETSDLSAVVDEGGDNDFDFELRNGI